VEEAASRYDDSWECIEYTVATNDKGWSCSLGVRKGAYTTPPKKMTLVIMVLRELFTLWKTQALETRWKV